MSNISILQGDCLNVLKTLPDQSVQCCVTSPPYYGLRDYIELNPAYIELTNKRLAEIRPTIL
jgi:predicted methyltransferase